MNKSMVTIKVKNVPKRFSMTWNVSEKIYADRKDTVSGPDIIFLIKVSWVRKKYFNMLKFYGGSLGIFLKIRRGIIRGIIFTEEFYF